MWTHWCARVCVPGAALIKVVVKEGSDAILPCSFSSRDIRQELFDWIKDKKDKKDKKEVFMYDKGKVYDERHAGQDEQFRGRVFHFPEHLDVGNASIVIRDTKLTDNGNYTCLFPHPPPGRRSNIVLVVGEFFHKLLKRWLFTVWGVSWLFVQNWHKPVSSVNGFKLNTVVILFSFPC